MGFDALMHAFGMTLQVGFIDLILSGDNALVIALACRALAPKQMRKAMLIGSGAAIGLRILFTLGISALLDVPGIKLVGSVALLVIAVRLLISDDEDDAAKSETAAASDLWSAVTMVVIADVVMSLDNVIALAAASQGSVFFLVLGLLLSVPLLMYGAVLVTHLLGRYPILIPAGSAFLGWIAGDIAMSDALIASWINSQSPALPVFVPALCAIFVVLHARHVKREIQDARDTAGVGVGRGPTSAWLARVQQSLAQAAATPVATPKAEAASKPTAAPDLAQAVLHQASHLVVDGEPAAVPVPDLPSEVITTALLSAAAPGGRTSAETYEAVADVLEATGTAATDAAAPEAFEGRPAQSARHLPWHRKGVFALLWSPAGAVVGLVAALGWWTYSEINSGLPTPRASNTYVCANPQSTFQYRHGSDVARLANDKGSLEGYVQEGRIEWTSTNETGPPLGIAPPTQITWEDAHSIRLNGGDFAQVDCLAR